MNRWFLVCLLACLVNCETIKYMETLSIPQLGKFSKRDTSFSVEFKAHDRTFQLDLERHYGFFADEAVFEYGPGEGEFQSLDFDTSVYYRGNAKMGSDNGILSLRLDEETQSLHGVLVGEEDNWQIESSSLHGNHEKPMVIYKWSDVNDGDAHKCGTSESHGLEKNTNGTIPTMLQHLRNMNTLRQASSTCVISLVADSRFFRGFQSKVYNSVKHMIDIMTNVEAIYRSQSLGGFQVASTRVFTDQNSDPYKDVATDAGKFLEAIQARRGDQGPSNKCLTHGFTQAEWNGPVGLAYVGHTCGSGGGSGVTTAIVPGLRFMTIVVAHEIGHNFGSNHDDGNTPNFIMSPSVGGNDQRLQFSPSSVSQMNNRKNSGGMNCFINKPAVLGTCGNGWQDPGEQCDCGTACGSDNFCTTSCTLKNGATCSPNNGPCCNNGQLAPRGQACGVSPLPGIPAPTCDGSSPRCPDCWPAGTHPNIYSNIKACDLKRDCKAGCAWDNNPNQCVTCKGIGVITQENLPDDSCCSNGGRCKGGVCQPAQASNPVVPPVATSAPVPPPPTGNCNSPAAGGTGSGLIGRYFKGNNFNQQVGQRTDPVIAFDWNVNSPPGTSLPADLFSIRWIGQVQPRFSGAWTFYTISDDGTRLWVNNVQLINDFIGHSKAQRSGGTSLTAGTKHNIKLEYYEGYVDAVIILQWSHACVKQENIPAAQLYPVAISTLDEGCAGYEGEGTGLKATYTASNGTVISSGLEGPIDFHWMGIPVDFGDKLSAVWEGFLQPRYSEDYTFHTNSSSGIKLTINGQVVINHMEKHNITYDSGTIGLDGGRGVPIKIEFWHEGPNENEGAINLMWSSPKCQSIELIGREYLYQSEDQIPSGELVFSSATSFVALVSFVLFFLF